jgi:hypothetical protein
MGDVLRNLTDNEIISIRRMSENSDFVAFREVLETSLNRLRENSDQILDSNLEFISKGKRLALKEILDVTNEKSIRTISEKVKMRQQ